MKHYLIMSCSNRHCTAVPFIVLFKKQFNKVLGQQSTLVKGLALTLFAVCLPLFLTGQQTFVMPVKDTLVIKTLPNCDSLFSFVSDSTNHRLYADATPRNDTLSICPPNQKQRIKIQFNAFDLAAGDTLFAFDAKIPPFPIAYGPGAGIGSGTGAGVSRAFGGWVAASCAPDLNPTGCVSFIFKTNGDGLASSGWRANIQCAARNIKITPPIIASSLLECSPAYKIVTIPAAMVSADCGTIANDSTLVRVRNSFGQTCIDTILSRNQNNSFADTFAIGTYLVEYKLKSDTSIQQETSFSVEPRILACNDTLNVGLGSNCGVRITPDILLEAPCDTLSDTLYYQITITVPDNKAPNGRKVIASGTGKAGDYPVITKEMIDICSPTIYLAEIKRVYYEGLNLSFCNNGRQSNSCWTSLRFEDKAKPLFLAPIQCDTIYACTVDMTPEALGLPKPLVADNCDSTAVKFSGFEILNLPTSCDTLNTYLAVWTATDKCGNSRQRKDTVKIFRPGLDKIIKAPKVILSCGEDDTTALNDLVRLGVPSIQIGRKKMGIFIPSDTIPLTANERVCHYNLGRRDVRVAVECNIKYFRYWQLIDWCSNSTVVINLDTQLIEFKDTLAPVINCPNFTTLATAEHLPLPANLCEMKVVLPLPTATDKCVAHPIVQEFTVEILEDSSWWSIATTLAEAGTLGCDTFRVGYRAFDGCHQQLKEDTCYRYFILEDVSAPTAICEDELFLSLSSDTTVLHANAIDGGSWDMCEVDTVLVRRTVCNDITAYQGKNNSYVADRLGNRFDAKGWGETLKFTCCDAHHPVFVELLVIDKKGNFNTCWMQITAEDKRHPICQPLAPATAFCDTYNDQFIGSETDKNGNELFDDAEWLPLVGELADFYNKEFGNPAETCEDNLTCNALMLEQEYQLIRQTCGEINIKRRYRAIDYGKNNSAWAEQLINLEYRANWKITFPSDQLGNCDSRLAQPATSPIQNGNCDQLSWEYEDKPFESGTNIFVKVLRTYSIINWCVYQPGQKPLVINRVENHQGIVTSPKMLSSDSLANVGFIQYTQILQVIDEDAPFLVLGKVDTVLLGKGDASPFGEEDQTLGEAPFECDAVRIFQIFARDCNEAASESLLYQWEFYQDAIMMATGTGDTFSQIVYPGPEYEVKWYVTDVFTNTSLIAKFYTFVDGLAPIAYCNNGIVAESNPSSRFVRVEAAMFDRGSYDNCTDQANLKKRLWHPVLNVPRPRTAMEVMALPTFLELGCLFLGTQSVSFYVMDEAGNFDFCETQLVIQNNMLSCSRRTVSGETIDQKGRPIEGVTMEVKSLDSNLSVSSDAMGAYEFTMPEGADYTVRPELDSQPLNGVSTFDLVLMSQHILGIKTFDSPYQYLAADVNRSGTITAFDIVQVRQLILNLIPKFTNNTSWRFVDMDYEFSNEASAMQLEKVQEEKTIHDVSDDRLGMDFLGVKIGDINGSAVPNRSVRFNGRNTNEEFSLMLDNQDLEKGKIYTVSFFAKDLSQIIGYQFTLAFKNLKLLHIEGGVAKLENFGRTYEAEGFLTTSWHSLQSHEVKSPLFTLTFQAITNGKLDELLNITSEHTPAEAYSFSGTFLSPILEFQEPSPIPFEVYQNTPNPFYNHTTIGFTLPAKGSVALQIVNAQGQVVQQQASVFQRGPNEIKLLLKDLPAGTYYYQLATPFGVGTKKMTKVR